MNYVKRKKPGNVSIISPSPLRGRRRTPHGGGRMRGRFNVIVG